MNKLELTSERLEELNELASTLGIQIHNYDFYEVALTHSSYSLQYPGAENNERLEYFGDAVLKFVIAEYLFCSYPDYQEGMLTEIGGVMMSASVLADIASELNLAKYLKLARGVSPRPSIIADAVEALLAAVYFDQGLDIAKELILKLNSGRDQEALHTGIRQNYKARLQELTQAVKKGLPEYIVLDKQGPDHQPVYTIEVYIEGKVMGRGLGGSKKIAEQDAAGQALERLEKEFDISQAQ